jgi:hypothetical protein
MRKGQTSVQLAIDLAGEVTRLFDAQGATLGERLAALKIAGACVSVAPAPMFRTGRVAKASKKTRRS